MDRKEKIIQLLNASEPVSASTLAKQLSVSRQIIVGDVALLRASGTPIISTPRGYLLEGKTNSKLYKVAVNHTDSQMQDELYTIVDLGGRIIDVIVEHPIYGELTGQLQIKSRYDVDCFVEEVKKSKSNPLSILTGGLHLHTIECDDKAIYERIIQALKDKGYLYM